MLHCIWCLCLTDVTVVSADATGITSLASVRSRPSYQLKLAQQLALLTQSQIQLSPRNTHIVGQQTNEGLHEGHREISNWIRNRNTWWQHIELKRNRD